MSQSLQGSHVDIGGRRLFLTVAGEGLPAVILEAGLGGTCQTWSRILPSIAQFTHVYAYDRAGLGQSDPAPIPRTCQDMVADLRALLTIAQIAPPYVLVGASFGGMIVRLFAAQNPAQVAGMVLIDASHEDRDAHFETVLSDELITRHQSYLKDPSRNEEHVDKLQSSAQLRAAPQHFHFPLIVLTRGLPDPPSLVWPSEALQQVETKLQREFLKLSPQSTHIIAERSGHFIQDDQPELVIQFIQQLIAQAHS